MKIVYHTLMKEVYDRTPAGALGRIDTAVQILADHPDYEFVDARPATEEEIYRAHGPGHIERVKGDYDTTREGLLYEVAALAAGGSIIAAEIAAEGEPAFGLIRPPGHHASRSSYWGFCYFNNISIALLHLRSKGLINSAYILDFDLHTGDGNINILEDEPGFILHNPSGRGDENYLRDVRKSLDASPDVDIVVASAGFDQYVDCWGSNLSTDAFKEIGRLLFEFSKDRCEGRRFGLLEGGYNHQALGKNVLAFCEGLRGK